MEREHEDEDDDGESMHICGMKKRSKLNILKSPKKPLYEQVDF
jgi:hypothetical protein